MSNDKKRLCLQCAYSHWPKHSEGECNAPGGEPVPIREARSYAGRCGPNAALFEDYIFEAFKQAEGSIIIRCKVCGVAHEEGQAPKHKSGCKCHQKPTTS